jgi:hypothetical protein
MWQRKDACRNYPKDASADCRQDCLVGICYPDAQAM